MDEEAQGPIELVLPADTRLVRIARLVASGVGNAAGLDLDEIEDLRIAVDEACTALIEGGDGTSLLLSFEVSGRDVHVVATTGASPNVSLDAQRLGLSRQILGVVVDNYRLVVEHGRLFVELDKAHALAEADG